MLKKVEGEKKNVGSTNDCGVELLLYSPQNWLKNDDGTVLKIGLFFWLFGWFVIVWLFFYLNVNSTFKNVPLQKKNK